MRIHWYWWGPTWHNEDPLGLPVIHQNPFWAMRVHKDPLGSIRTNFNPFGSMGIHKHSSISFTFILLNDFLEIWSIIVVYVTIDGSLHGSHILAYLEKKTVKILVPQAQFWYPIWFLNHRRRSGEIGKFLDVKYFWSLKVRKSKLSSHGIHNIWVVRTRTC